MRDRPPLLSTVNAPSYKLVLGLFAAAILINMTPGEFYARPILWSIAYVLSLLLFISIRFWWAAVGVIILEIIIIGVRFPRAANHSNMELFISIFATSLIVFKYLRPAFTIQTSAISLLFRITAVGLYFYSGFHKLNTDFLNFDVSCASFINQLPASSRVENSTNHHTLLLQLMQWGTLFLELVLPWALLWHRTRKYTAILFIMFHFYLTFMGLANFGGFAAFILFGCLYDFSNPVVSQKLRQWFRVYIGSTLLAIAANIVMQKVGIAKPTRDLIYCSLFNLGYGYFFLNYLNEYMATPSRYNKQAFTFGSLAFLLLSIWTLKAYVGLGNTANLTMYSNLITE